MGIETNKITITNWSILHQQDSSIEKIKKSNKWDKITIPSFIKHNYVPIRDFQYLWLKGKFEIKDDPSKFFGINLGRIYYTDIVYINDKIIGQTKSQDNFSVHYPRSYKIRQDILKKGKNEIYIYIGVYGKQSAGILNEVLILDQKLFKNKEQYRLFIYHYFPMGLAVMFFLLSLFLVIFYFFNKNETSIIFSFIFCFMYTISFFLYFANNYSMNDDLRLTILYYLSALNPLNWVLILQAFFKKYYSELNKAILIYGIVITFLFFSNIDTTSDLYLARVLNSFTIILTIFAAPYLLYKIYCTTKDKTKIFLFIFYFSFISLFYIIIFLFSLNGKFRYTVQDMYYIPFLVVHLITLIIRDIIKKETEIQNRYKKVKGASIEA